MSSAVNYIHVRPAQREEKRFLKHGVFNVARKTWSILDKNISCLFWRCFVFKFCSVTVL